MSFQLSLLRGKPGRAYSKKNHQINGVAPSARWRLKCWHSMNQNLQAGVLAHLTSDSIKQVWCCFFPGLSSTTSLKQFHVSRSGKIVPQFFQVLGLWLAMGCPQLRQFHLGAIPLVVNFVRGTRRLQRKGYNYHNSNANSVVKPKNCHTPKS